MKPLGTYLQQYQVEFVVVDDDYLTPILGNPTIQRIDLVRVQHQNVMAVNTEVQCSSQKKKS